MREAGLLSASFGSLSENVGAPDSIPVLLIELALILASAKLAGHVASRLGQPGVLGELIVGVLLGAASAAVLPGEVFDILAASTGSGSHLFIIGELGILLLLFRVGLECRPQDLLSVGYPSLAVAVGGVLLPLTLGFVVCSAFAGIIGENTTPWQMHLFVGATMAATSVGVTARVLSDMNRIHDREARIILGAAVIDDILGLLLLAVVAGVIASGSAENQQSLLMGIATVGLGATAFVVIGTIAGVWIARYYVRFLESLEGAGAHAAGLLAFCFVFSALAELAGLAALVGAFMAGLVVNDTPRTNIVSGEDTGRGEQELAPITTILAPVFFVLMGMQVKFDVLLSPSGMIYVVTTTVVALLGKFVVGFLVPGPLPSKIFVGAGMIPRGEVGLIFAAVGRGTGAIGDQTFSALVLMVILTTAAGPLLLKWASRRLPANESTVVSSA